MKQPAAILAQARDKGFSSSSIDSEYESWWDTPEQEHHERGGLIDQLMTMVQLTSLVVQTQLTSKTQT